MLNGMGGMGGMGGMPMGGMGGMGGMPGGMGGMPGGMGGMPRRPQKPKAFEHRLPCALEDLYRGTTKRLKITRNVRGRKMEEVLEIPIRAGFKKGTKVTFPGKGDEPAPGVAGDVVFVVDEKPHSTFKREGNDLAMKQTVPLVRALTEFAFNVTTLDGRTVRVDVQGPVSPGQVKVVEGEGMPVPKTQGAKRGDLKVEFAVAFPQTLSAQQKSELKRILS